MTDEPSAGVPPPPEPSLPAEDWEHHELYVRVREAVMSLPVQFRTETHISGILATDLYTLSGVLGAAIEEQVVRTLNLARHTWDPEGRYTSFQFVRQAQTFPDVLLRQIAGDEIILGIELKGWYLLAKETEPSLRFRVTESACAPQDLLVVVPWVLDNVISGSPTLFEPFVESAKQAAASRNYYWRHVRKTELNREIDVPEGIQPYPRKSDQIDDKPRADDSNFGRLARTRIMDEYRQKLDHVQLCGISSKYWRDFLKIFREKTTDKQARAALDHLRRKIERSVDDLEAPKAQSALAIVKELEGLLDLSDDGRLVGR